MLDRMVVREGKVDARGPHGEGERVNEEGSIKSSSKTIAKRQGEARLGKADQAEIMLLGMWMHACKRRSERESVCACVCR